jgi:peptidoglycan hydrolase-like protein with peptidoglycan-binding domain
VQKKRIARAAGAITMACVLFFSSFNVSAASSAGLLKKGMRGNEVKQLQSDLKTLGYFNANTTGYYGSITYSSVIKLQRDYGYAQDGIVGRNTHALIDRLLDRGNSSSRSASVSSRSVLKKGMRGDDITALQNDLKKLGYFSVTPTGYYGDITVSSVKNLQRDYGLAVDGIVGRNTSSLIAKLKENPSSVAKVNTSSRGNSQRTNYMAPWYSEASRIFPRGSTATVYDIDTGLSFKIKRTYGTNHADCETLTAEDTKIMKKIYGGSWSWARRAIIVDVNGTKLAASMAGMPHAGVENAPANKTVSSRSGGYGRGTNLDAVKGNNMSGVFDIHFYQSKTHGTQRVDKNHQAAVKKAAEWAKKNLG